MLKRLIDLFSKWESVSTKAISGTREELVEAPSVVSRVQFLRLPSELLVTIYTEWLSARSLFYMDSAICSKQHRQEWLHFLKNMCQLKCIELNVLKDRQFVIHWLASRCVRVSQLVLADHRIHCARYIHELDRWLERCGSEIRYVLFCRCDRYTLQCIERHCTNLPAVVFSNVFSIEPFWEILRAKSHTLSTVAVGASYDCNVCDVIPTDIFLPCVRNLTVDMKLFDQKRVFIDFLSRFPCVQKLRLEQFGTFGYLVGELNKNATWLLGLCEILPNLKYCSL